MIEISRKIIKDLEKVGFPTEIAISSQLEDAGWMVENGALFEDTEQNKSRELDIHALTVDFSLANKIAKIKSGGENKLISHLIIEVKKSDKPWVFFDNGKPNWEELPEQNIKSEQDLPTMFEHLEEFGLKSHRYKKAKFHKSNHVAFTKPSEPSSIYEVQMKIPKALLHFKKRYAAGGYSTHLFTPVVVFEGQLWSATLNKNGKVNLKKVDYLFTYAGYLTKSGKKENSYEENQIYDVVTRDFFSNYLKMLEKDNKELYKAWTKYVI